jgi:hypothetical protein
MDFFFNESACSKVSENGLQLLVQGPAPNPFGEWVLETVPVADCKAVFETRGTIWDGKSPHIRIPVWGDFVDNRSEFWGWNPAGGYWETQQNPWAYTIISGVETPAWTSAKYGTTFQIATPSGWVGDIAISVIDSDVVLAVCGKLPCACPEDRIVVNDIFFTARSPVFLSVCYAGGVPDYNGATFVVVTLVDGAVDFSDAK